MQTETHAPVIGGEIAVLRAALAAAQADRAPLADRLGRYQAEVREIQGFLETVTPEQGDPVSVVAAQSRIAILDRAIGPLEQQIAPFDRAIAEARSALALAEQQLASAQHLLKLLREADHVSVTSAALVDYRIRVSTTRAAIARLSGVEPEPVVLTFE